MLRLFNVYGGPQPRDLLFGYIARQIRTDAPVVLHTADSRRDFVHVFDVVRAIVLAANRNEGFSVFNIGTGIPHAVREIVEGLEQRLGRAMESEFNAGEDPLPWVVADTARAEKVMGWRSRISFSDGLDEFAVHLTRQEA